MKTAIVFPGQGAQVPNMGKEIAESNAECMKYWEMAEEYSSLNLRSIFWEEKDATAMMQTSAVQPALTCVFLSLLHAYNTLDECSYFAGHSLGEFSALYASKVLSAEDVLRITATRGKLMQNADPNATGGMLAILKLSIETLTAIVTKIRKEANVDLIIANYNTPSQYIVSGEKSVFPQLIEAVSQNKGRAIPLVVSGAFHSPMMEDAEIELQSTLESVKWNNATTPFYSNTTATPLVQAEEIQRAMTIQMTSPVRWIEIVRHMEAQGITKYIELAPKAILASLIKASLIEPATIQTLSSYEDFRK